MMAASGKAIIQGYHINIYGNTSFWHLVLSWYRELAEGLSQIDSWLLMRSVRSTMPGTLGPE